MPAHLTIDRILTTTGKSCLLLQKSGGGQQNSFLPPPPPDGRESTRGLAWGSTPRPSARRPRVLTLAPRQGWSHSTGALGRPCAGKTILCCGWWSSCPLFGLRLAFNPRHRSPPRREAWWKPEGRWGPPDGNRWWE